ncbi:IS3 family transposase [Thalassobium sp. R2A62]|uniref:IS3 family transposase n=1 Tax=Thalassobium sp. R2A62 TaxID=633131 RepID=UPI00350E3B58
MKKNKCGNRYSPEVRERAVRMVFEHQGEFDSQSAAIKSIAPKIGCGPDTLRAWVRRAETDSGRRDGVTTAERDRIKALERENRQLRQANEILKKASAYFCSGGARPPVSEVISFIKEHRDVCGVEPICRVLQIAPSTFYAHLAVEDDPDKASDRAKRDAELRAEMKRIWDDNQSVYGARKLWHAMRREGYDLAHCTVERLMRDIGIEGVRRGKKVKTTWADKALPCPMDRVNRQFRATMPNQLWVSDFTYVSTWQGFVYVAFVIDTFANKIVGWRASRSQQTQFVLDALEQALYERWPSESLIHHSDRGSQYLSIKYTERLADAGLEPSVGTVGDSYDNALAETMFGLFKAEVIHRLEPWKSADAVEWETLNWVDWFNNRRLLEPIGYITPTEAEEAFYANMNTLDKVA